MVVGQKATQEVEMGFAPFGNPLVIVAIRDRGAHHQQQHLRQRMRDAPCLARVLDLGKMFQQHAQSRLLGGEENGKAHGAAPNQDPLYRIRFPASENTR